MKLKDLSQLVNIMHVLPEGKETYSYGDMFPDAKKEGVRSDNADLFVQAFDDLISLDGMPDKTGASVFISNCRRLESLEGLTPTDKELHIQDMSSLRSLHGIKKCRILYLEDLTLDSFDLEDADIQAMYIDDCEIRSFKGFPQGMKSLVFRNKSGLHARDFDVTDFLKHVKELQGIRITPTLKRDDEPLLGIRTIKGMTNFGVFGKSDNDIAQTFDILKYDSQHNIDLFTSQEKLINAGFGRFARIK